MKNIDEYIKEIKDAVTVLKECHQQYYDSEILVAYRGESRDYMKTRLMPSLFRESAYPHKEAHLFELFCDYNMVSNNASNIEKAIEAQHYASISRMLDISFNTLVALYFACNDNYHDGHVYVFAFPEHYSPHSNYIEEFYTNVLAGRHIAYSKNFKVFSHSYTNDRIKAQKGGFIFFPGTEFLPINECYLKDVTIFQEDKERIRENLDILFQINEATIYPEKDKIAEVVKKRFMKNRYSSRSVSVLDEVDTYFSRINYELKLSSDYKSPQKNKYFLRLLRKEERDIVNYVKSNVQENQERVLQTIVENFKILRIKFREV